MQRFADFALEITLPPNPVRALDNALTPAQASGREFYFGGPDPDNPQMSDGIAGGFLFEPGFTGFTCSGWRTSTCTTKQVAAASTST